MSDDPVQIPQELLDVMVTHALETNPEECCGVVLRFPDGAQKLYRTTNAADEGQRPFRFDIPAGELLHLYRLMSDQEADHYLVYHSHTMTEARPSPTDLRFARHLVGPDPWPYWLLVSLASDPPSVRVWRIVEEPDDDPEAVNGVKPVEVGFEVVPLPAGSEVLQLRSDGDERRPVVSETPKKTKRAPAKKTARKATKKTARKAAKKKTKRAPAKKTARKATKKTARKATKKTARKAANLAT